MQSTALLSAALVVMAGLMPSHADAVEKTHRRFFPTKQTLMNSGLALGAMLAHSARSPAGVVAEPAATQQAWKTVAKASNEVSRVEHFVLGRLMRRAANRDIVALRFGPPRELIQAFVKQGVLPTRSVRQMATRLLNDHLLDAGLALNAKQFMTAFVQMQEGVQRYGDIGAVPGEFARRQLEAILGGMQLEWARGDRFYSSKTFQQQAAHLVRAFGMETHLSDQLAEFAGLRANSK